MCLLETVTTVGCLILDSYYYCLLAPQGVSGHEQVRSRGNWGYWGQSCWSFLTLRDIMLLQNTSAHFHRMVS